MHLCKRCMQAILTAPSHTSWGAQWAHHARRASSSYTTHGPTYRTGRKLMSKLEVAAALASQTPDTPGLVPPTRPAVVQEQRKGQQLERPA
jgi:hypothetical protein